MSIKLALLKSGDYIISDAKELLTDGDKVCGYLFSDPHRVTLNSPVILKENMNEESESLVNITLSPWIILSQDREIAVSPDWVVTAVEPISSLKELYEEKVNGKECEVSTLEG